MRCAWCSGNHVGLYCETRPGLSGWSYAQYHSSLRSENEALRAAAQKAARALQEAMGAHFNLYKAHWGEGSDPDWDIVRKDMREALAALAECGVKP